MHQKLRVVDLGPHLEIVQLLGALVEQPGLLDVVVAPVIVGQQQQRLAVQRILVNDLLECLDGLGLLAVGQLHAGLELQDFQPVGLVELVFVDRAYLREQRVAAIKFPNRDENVRRANRRGDFPALVCRSGIAVRREGEVVRAFVDVNIGELIEHLGVGLAHAADDLVVGGGFFGFSQAKVGVGLMQPVVGVVRLCLDQLAEQRHALAVLLLLQLALGDAEFPVELVRREKGGLAIGRLGREIFFTDQVAVADEAINVAVLTAELERAHQFLLRLHMLV